MGWQDVKEFVIDRSKWARRGKNGESKLLNDQGGMCCLGFYSKACGVPDEHLIESAAPGDLRCTKYSDNVAPWLKTKEGFDSDEAFSLMMSNDGKASAVFMYCGDDHSEEALEAFITTKFAEHGVTVTFIDGAPQEAQ